MRYRCPFICNKNALCLKWAGTSSLRFNYIRLFSEKAIITWVLYPKNSTIVQNPANLDNFGKFQFLWLLWFFRFLRFLQSKIIREVKVTRVIKDIEICRNYLNLQDSGYEWKIHTIVSLVYNFCRTIVFKKYCKPYRIIIELF